MNPIENADIFLSTGNKFRLGHLVTEQPHPLTQDLSTWTQVDLLKAHQILNDVDQLALNKFLNYEDDIKKLSQSVQKTLTDNRRIFLCGCGATGRLSLSLEYLWRKLNPQSESVKAFMAGGDIALVHAIEGFEDFPEYGARQLKDLGFQDGDLLISITEGGETPFVIGATEQALKISHRTPFFIFCNPKAVLCETVERSRRIIDNPKVQSFSWEVGPMAVAGSTRMQASSVLQLGVGLALFNLSFDCVVSEVIPSLKNQDTKRAAKFSSMEAQVYKDHHYVHYIVEDSAITIFTDTTERAPTFSLQSFRPLKEAEPLSLAYISILGTKNEMSAWQSLLNRRPNSLGWEFSPYLTEEYLLSFDFSEPSLEKRKQLLNTSIETFYIQKKSGQTHLQFKGEEWSLELPKQHILLEQIVLKMIMNNHSTAIMGILGRYEGNLMTWVKPNNGKLIDRATRYVGELLKKRDINVSYEEIVRKIFELKSKLKPTDSIVLATVKSFTGS